MLTKEEMMNGDHIEQLNVILEGWGPAFFEALEAHEDDDEFEPPDFEPAEEANEEVFADWFGDEAKEARLNGEFLGIGQRGCGSIAAIWCREGADLDTAPVALISSEGEVSVIAPNVKTLLYLVAQGYDLMQLHTLEVNAPWSGALPDLLSWIDDEWGKITASPAATIKGARAKSPGLSKYLGLS